MPSASPLVSPVVADMAAQMVSMVDQWTRQIVTIQNELNSAWIALAQDLNQAVVASLQQWDHLLGIDPSAPNQMLGTAAQQSSSGSRAATKEQIAPSVPPHPFAPPNPNNFTWDPEPGSDSASSGWNWLLNGQSQFGNPFPLTPGANDNVIFDGSVSNAHIEWDGAKAWVFGTMSLGNSNGNANTAYTGQQNIAAGTTVEMTGDLKGIALYTNVPSSNLYLYFEDAGTIGPAKFNIDANALITNMTLAGFANGSFNINGGVTQIANALGYTETIGVPFNIQQGATLNDWSYDTLTFTNDRININVHGALNVAFGQNPGKPLINTSALFGGDTIVVSGGGAKLSYLGAGGKTDTFTVPVRVDSGGTLYLDVMQGQSNGGTLVVQGNNSLTKQKSVYMTDTFSSVQMINGDTLECDQDYYQDNGTLKTLDASTCTLKAGTQGGGTATVAGGVVWIDTLANTYGELDVKAANLDFGGELNVSIVGYDPKNPPPPPNRTSDVLKVVNGNFNLKPEASTSLLVNVYGTLQANDSWIIINSNSITSDDPQHPGFASKSNSTGANLNYWLNTPNPGQYEITI